MVGDRIVTNARVPSVSRIPTKAVTPLTIVSSQTVYSWHRADQGITLNGSAVSQWNDLSGNGYHATQGTPANQPPYSASGINGRPAISFNGSNSYRLDTGTSHANAVVNGTAKPFTLWIVLNQAGAATNAQQSVINFADVFSAPTTATVLIPRLAASATYSVLRNTPGGTFDAPSGGTVTNGKHILKWTYTGSTHILLKEGSTAISSASTENGNVSAVGMRIGQYDNTTQQYNGFVGEIICMSGVPTVAESAALDEYILSMWGA